MGAVFADNPFVLSLCLPRFEGHFSLESGAGITLAMLIGFSKMYKTAAQIGAKNFVGDPQERAI